jgi:hypothetical protein
VLLLCAVLCIAAPASADDATTALRLAQARAKAKEGKVKEAARLYRALFLDDPDIDCAIFGEAVHVAMQAKKFHEAGVWAERCLPGAPEPYFSSPAAAEVRALIPKIAEGAARQRIEDQATAAKYVAEAIEGLVRERKLLEMAWLERVPDREDPAKPAKTGEKAEPESARVRDELFDDFAVLTGVVVPSTAGEHVLASFTEWFDDRPTAESRVRTILAQIRSQKSAWEQRFALRTPKDAFALVETRDPRGADGVVPGAAAHKSVVSFEWDVPEALKSLHRPPATVELERPAGKPEKSTEGPFIVRLRLDSTSFR